MGKTDKAKVGERIPVNEMIETATSPPTMAVPLMKPLAAICGPCGKILGQWLESTPAPALAKVCPECGNATAEHSKIMDAGTVLIDPNTGRAVAGRTVE